jgi:DNA-binding MarR family transcriptional regulator
VNNYLAAFNKVFESRVRLGIMSILLVNEVVDFGTLKEQLQLTDGNMASHLAALEKAQYISITKKFVGKKPNTTYTVTEEGKNAFNLHIDALEKLIQKTN